MDNELPYTTAHLICSLQKRARHMFYSDVSSPEIPCNGQQAIAHWYNESSLHQRARPRPRLSTTAQLLSQVGKATMTLEVSVQSPLKV